MLSRKEDMMSYSKLPWLLCLSCCVSIPSVALGQSQIIQPHQNSQGTNTAEPGIKQEPDWLTPIPKAGTPVRVIERSGKSTTGRLVDILPSAIRLASGGVTLEVPLTEIAVVQRNGDSLWNGIALGGGVAGVLFLGYNGDCDICYSTAELASFRLALAGIGAGVGALLDLMVRDKRVLYQATSTATASRRIARKSRDKH